jgi:hypothetical protein
MPPSDIDGWALWAKPDVTLILVKDGVYQVAMQCQPRTLAITVRSLAPAQAFPQPPMTVEINDFKWTGTPEAEMRGDGPELNANAYVFNDAPAYRALIDGLRRNTRARVAFNGEVLQLPVVPPDIGKTIADDCEEARWRR